jgi:mRNA-degrading endonuclease YafQ of YafQ-DinJ toxin-antitoxin module
MRFPMTSSDADPSGWTLIATEGYKRALKAFVKKHRDLTAAHARALRLLEVNPYDPSLKLHPLHGGHEGEWAVSITYSFRLTLTLVVIERQILLLDVGSHDDVYRR